MRRAARDWLFVTALSLPVAAECETYAVVPLVGRQLTIVTAEPTTASNVDRNQYRYYPVADAVFDDTVHAAVHRVVTTRRAGDRTVIVRVAMDPDREQAGSREFLAKVIGAVAPKAYEARASRLVVVAPYRATPWLAVDQGHLGTGNAAGIGLYVNRFQLFGAEKGKAASSYGFLGVFANVRVLLVDAQTSVILAEDVSRAGTTVSAVDAPDGNPFNALTAAKKVEYIRSILAQAVEEVLPKLMDKTPQRTP